MSQTVPALATPLSLTRSRPPDRPRTVHLVPDEPGAGLDPTDHAQLRRALSRAVARVCPAWMATHGEDIVQIAMAKVLRAMERGKAADEIGRAYLARVAYNALVDEMRKQTRRRALSTVGVDEAPMALVTDAADPESATASAELGREIRDCLGRMAQSRRLAVTLYLEGRGATEIAEMVDWKRKQADNLVYRGLNDLRRCLTDKGLTP